MPIVETKHFGPIEYQEEAVFEFPAGIPGFEDQTRFLPIEQPANKPLVFLQSLLRPELCFLALPARVVDSEYRLAISAEDLRDLGLPEDCQPLMGEEVLCLTILTVRGDRPPTANLLSPIVVNLKPRCAVQAIQADSGYSCQHPLFPAPEEAKC